MVLRFYHLKPLADFITWLVGAVPQIWSQDEDILIKKVEKIQSKRKFSDLEARLEFLLWLRGKKTGMTWWRKKKLVNDFKNFSVKNFETDNWVHSRRCFLLGAVCSPHQAVVIYCVFSLLHLPLLFFPNYRLVAVNLSNCIRVQTFFSQALQIQVMWGVFSMM